MSEKKPSVGDTRYVEREGQMKAYWVQDEWGEGNGCVQFTVKNVVARRNGANALDVAFGNVSCRRVLAWDQFADAGYVPMEDQIEHGCWFECSSCWSRIDANTKGRVVSNVSERAWCHAECHAQSVAKRHS